MLVADTTLQLHMDVAAQQCCAMTLWLEVHHFMIHERNEIMQLFGRPTLAHNTSQQVFS